jgi:hypothetical protein
MNFTDAETVEQTVWAMRLADWPRGTNRARINDLANGAPPYTDDEAARNNIEINVNDLTLTRVAHDGRQQLYNGFMKPGKFFTARTDMGTKHKRLERGITVTNEINRVLKRSLEYYECFRSKFALDVLHGIGPSMWENREGWCPEPLGVEEVLIPSNTKLTFKNMPFFAVFRGYTPEELHRLTQGPKRDRGWNMPVVRSAIKWACEQTSRLMGVNWQDWWSPEKLHENFKENSGLYASDQVQTIDCYDFYYWHDDGKNASWRRKIILDAWGGWEQYGPNNTMPDKNLIGKRGQFLFDGGDRVYGSKLSEIIHFQFADLSAVAPFRYHSVRSLGFLLYAACHLQNRLRCKFNEAVFENLMMYMRVKSMDEAERALKIELASRGIIDETVHFLSPAERWQPNEALAIHGITMNQQVIQENSSSHVQNQNFSRDRVEKTKFQVMAEVNAMQTLVSSALQQAYTYQTYEYYELLRRFFIQNSRDVDVKEFRVRCLKRGVPENMLIPEAWEIEPERVMGAGNKTMEMAIAQQLMEWRPAFSPASQQTILRNAVLAITDDPAMADRLVPESANQISHSKEAAMLAIGTLMDGGLVQFSEDKNRIELIDTLLAEMTVILTRLKQTAQPTQSEVAGLMNVAAHVQQLVQSIAGDEANQERAKGYGNLLGKMVNEIKALAQMVPQQGNGEMDGKMLETLGKIQAQKITAEAKAANTRESHAQRTGQRQVAWDMQQEQKEQQHQLDMRRTLEQQRVDDAAKVLETASKIQMDRMNGPSESKEP